MAIHLLLFISACHSLLLAVTVYIVFLTSEDINKIINCLYSITTLLYGFAVCLNKFNVLMSSRAVCCVDKAKGKKGFTNVL